MVLKVFVRYLFFRLHMLNVVKHLNGFELRPFTSFKVRTAVLHCLLIHYRRTACEPDVEPFGHRVDRRTEDRKVSNPPQNDDREQE